MSRIIDFAHDDATRLDVSGGKGASLAKSARELSRPARRHRDGGGL